MHKLKPNFYDPLQQVLAQVSKTKIDAIMFCWLNIKCNKAISCSNKKRKEHEKLFAS